jgi:hypothetical protein
MAPPEEAPFTFTETPGSAAPEESLTTPVTSFFTWALAEKPTNKDETTNKIANATFGLNVRFMSNLFLVFYLMTFNMAQKSFIYIGI